MPVTFTGTSTGTTYVAGQSYVSAGRVYTAQSDGTFRTTNRDGTSRSTVGSSQDTRVTWGTTGGGSVGSGPGAREVAQAREAASAGRGPGRAGAVSSGAGGAPGTGPGTPGAARVPVVSPTRGVVLGGAFLGGMPGSTTTMYVGGWELPRSVGTSDGGDGEQRWGEFGGSIYGLGVMALDGAEFIRQYGQGWRNIPATIVGPAAEHSSNYNWNAPPVEPPSRAPVTGPAQPERPWALTGQYAIGAYSPTYPTVDYRPFQ